MFVLIHHLPRLRYLEIEVSHQRADKEWRGWERSICHRLSPKTRRFQSVMMFGNAIYHMSGLDASYDDERDHILCDVTTARRHGESLEVVESKVRYWKCEETVQVLRR